MKLSTLLDENHLLLGHPAATLEEAFRALVLAFGEAIDPDQINGLVEELMARERQHPTMLADTAVLPHMRLEWLEVFLVGILVPEKPLAHPAAGQPPAALVFMILAPQSKNTMMLQTLAAVARLLKSRETVQAMLKARQPARLLRLIEESGVDVKKNLVAADLMQPIQHWVTTETVLARAVDVLVDAPDEGIPVLDTQKRLVGELTSRELLALGMPKYLHLLANSELLNAFEPFENFFRHENTLKVREVCRRDIVTVDPAMPVVQVAHQMIIHQKRRVYVVDNGDVKGVIYRKTIVSKVLHY